MICGQTLSIYRSHTGRSSNKRVGGTRGCDQRFRTCIVRSHFDLVYRNLRLVTLPPAGNVAASRLNQKPCKSEVKTGKRNQRRSHGPDKRAVRQLQEECRTPGDLRLQKVYLSGSNISQNAASPTSRFGPFGPGSCFGKAQHIVTRILRIFRICKIEATKESGAREQWPNHRERRSSPCETAHDNRHQR